MWTLLKNAFYFTQFLTFKNCYIQKNTNINICIINVGVYICNIDKPCKLSYYLFMDSNEPNTTPNTQGSSKRLIIIGVCLAVLVILIVITFNFFNILPSSIPVLPHQAKNNTQYQINSGSNGSQTTANIAKCQFIPPGVAPDFGNPVPNASRTQPSFVGAWEGKWGNQVPSGFIVKEIKGREASVIYVYKGKIQPELVKISLIGKTRLANSKVSFDIYSGTDGNILNGVYFQNNKPVSSVVMKPCIPSN